MQNRSKKRKSFASPFKAPGTPFKLPGSSRSVNTASHTCSPKVSKQLHDRSVWLNIHSVDNENLASHPIETLEEYYSILQQKIKEERPPSAAKPEDTENIKLLQEKWTCACQEAIEELYAKIKKASPEQNLSILDILRQLQLDPEFVRFDEKEESFY